MTSPRVCDLPFRDRLMVALSCVCLGVALLAPFAVAMLSH